MKALLVSILFLSMTACTIVGPGERGVSVSLGSVGDEAKMSGAYLWVPFLRGMAKVDVQIQKSEVETSAASKDMQELTTHVAINWSIDPAQVIALYKSVGDENDVFRRIIQPAVSETLKAATATRTAEEILTKRLEVKTDLDNQLKARLAKYGIHIDDVSIMNFKFSEQFTNAIEAKQVSEQRAKQAQYETEKAEQDAKAAVAKARGEAESNRMKQQTITENLIKYEMVQKWNGVLPTVNAGGSSPFMLNFNGNPK